LSRTGNTIRWTHRPDEILKVRHAPHGGLHLLVESRALGISSRKREEADVYLKYEPQSRLGWRHVFTEGTNKLAELAMLVEAVEQGDKLARFRVP